jgi:hypothetical protein
MAIKLSAACPHVSRLSKEQLEADANTPTVASCLACSKVIFNEQEVSSERSDYELLPVSPGMDLGKALFASFTGQDRFGLGLEAKLSPTGIRAMFVNGSPGGSLYIIRKTPDGPVLLFPGSSTRWHDRFIHPDDLFWFFGDTISDPRIAKGEATVYSLLQDGIKQGHLNLGVRSLARVG